MSWQASAWAANVPHNVVGYVAFRSLMLLANHADEDGRNAWLAPSTVAARLEVSHRTAERAFSELRHARMIIPGEQRLVDHLPTNRRPVVYDLNMASYPQVRPDNFDPSGLSAPTFDVGSLEEEPPLDKSPSRDNQTGHVGPVDRCATHRADRGHEYLPSGYCLHCGASQPIGETE